MKKETDKKPPAFQLYANDWLGSTRITLMTPAEEGAYIRLLCHAWNDRNCSLPDNDDVLAVLSRLGNEWFNGSGKKLRGCFEPHPEMEGRLINPRLYAVLREMQEKRESRQRGALITNEKRWGYKQLEEKESLSDPQSGRLKRQHGESITDPKSDRFEQASSDPSATDERLAQRRSSTATSPSYISKDIYSGVSQNLLPGLTKSVSKNCSKRVHKKKSKPKFSGRSSESDRILNHLNSRLEEVTGKKGRYSLDSKEHLKQINGRLNDRATVEQCIEVIDRKIRDPFFRENPKHLNPATLFRPSNFTKYLEEPELPATGGGRRPGEMRHHVKNPDKYDQFEIE